jgi:hypothetical protein
MSYDAREAILVHLFSLLAGLDGFVSCFRNASELDITQLPGLVLLDGKEEILTRPGRNIVQMPPAEFILRPEVFALLPMANNVTTGLDVTVNGVPYGSTSVNGKEMGPLGPLLSAYRATIVPLILYDQDLLALVGPNGQVLLESTATDMQTGSTIGVQGATIMFSFAIKYVLDPTQLGTT